jgi:hypothetical protein
MLPLNLLLRMALLRLFYLTFVCNKKKRMALLRKKKRGMTLLRLFISLFVCNEATLKKKKGKKSENHLTVALSNLALALGLEQLVVGAENLETLL